MIIAMQGAAVKAGRETTRAEDLALCQITFAQDSYMVCYMARNDIRQSADSERHVACDASSHPGFGWHVRNREIVDRRTERNSST